MPNKKSKVAERMQQDSKRASLEANASLLGFSKEDVAKLYDKYGPYAPDLIYKAASNPIELHGLIKARSLASSPFTDTKTVIKELLEVNLNDTELGIVLGKPSGEVTATLKEYRDMQAATQTYQTICGGTAKSSVSVETLLAAGVKPEDFQAAFEQDETLAFNIGKSPSNNAIVNAAAHTNNGKATGNCGVGTKQVCDTIPGNSTSRALKTTTPAYALAEGIPADGASGYYARLEQSGNYVVLTKPNEACVDTTNIPNAKKRDHIIKNRHSKKNMEAIDRMCDFTDQLPRGTIITWDNHTIVENEKVKPLGGGNGITYGHVCIKTEDPSAKGKKYKCDGQQQNPHYAGWYGKNIRMCYNIDSQIPAEYAELLIAQAQARTGQCLNVEENKKAYYAGTKTTLKAQNKAATQKKAKTGTGKSSNTSRSKSSSTSRSKSSASRSRSSTSRSKSSASRSKSSTSRSRSSSTTRRTTGRGGR